MAHLCGLCLALRGEHGQLARVATNYDGLIVSVLTEAQSERAGGWRRGAGPCPLRGMRSADVAQGEGARLAATVSLVLAAAKVRDHVSDGDGLLGRRPVSIAARRIARGWDRAGAASGERLGFDTAVLLDAVARQPEIERLAGPGDSLLTITEPTETATAAAFAHTAILAGRPGNAEPLDEAGRLFGRLAHLLDAVEDLDADKATGAWNPITVTGSDLTEVRRLCDDAVYGIRLALSHAEFTDGRLVRALLGDELDRAVDRVFSPCHHQHHRQGPRLRLLPRPGIRTTAEPLPTPGTTTECGIGTLTPQGAPAMSRHPVDGQCRRCGRWGPLCRDCGYCTSCCTCGDDGADVGEPWQGGDSRQDGAGRDGSGGDGWSGGPGGGGRGSGGSGNSGGGSGDGCCDGGGCCNPCKCCDCCD